MIRWLFWVAVIGLIVYGGYTIVNDLIHGTPITSRKGVTSGGLDRAPDPSDSLPEPPKPAQPDQGQMGDSGGMFGF